MSKNPDMKLGSTSLKDDVLFIAEGGVNHNGDLERAKELVEVAAESGANAVKFQTFSAERLVTQDGEATNYQKEELEDDLSQYEMLKRYELDTDAHVELKSHCAEHDIKFLSTPFDVESADFLAELGVPAMKIGSGELTNKPLLEHVADFGVPLIVSTGMSTLEEVQRAHDWIRSVDKSAEVVFLHCVSAYPTPLKQANLRAMETMQSALDTPVGFSDHTLDVETSGFAIAMGAPVVEKHLTLDKSLPGPDHSASLEPAEFAQAVTIARKAATARGSAEKEPAAAERENIHAIRKSLHAAEAILAGEMLDETNVAVKRPAAGASPDRYATFLGQRASRDIERGEPLTDTCIETDGTKES